MASESKTKVNLQIALAGEADANRRYTAYGIRALHEGHPEIAQLFFEVAGAETVHAYSHLLALDAIGTTEENLRRAAIGETDEIEEMYPRMIAEAEAEGDHRAAASFRLALEREKYHQQMFRRALDAFGKRQTQQVLSRGEAPTPAAPATRDPSSQTPETPKSDRRPASGSREPTVREIAEAESKLVPRQREGASGPDALDRAAAAHGLREIKTESERIARLAGIREIVFGSQDGLISTTTLVLGIAATTSQSPVVLVAGAVATLAGALSMGVGSYLASRAQRQLYESELAGERREIAEKPGEETAELIAALIGRGLSRRDAVEVVRRITPHPRLMIELLGALELGLTPASLGSPLRDALVMGAAFAAGSIVPLLPFMALDVKSALAATMVLALVTLFAIGAVKAWLSGRRLIASGLEVMLLGSAAGALGYGMGRLVAAIFGVKI